MAATSEQTALIIGDVHAPYTDTAALKQIIVQAGRLKPTFIVQMGDLYDQYAFSKYPKSPNHDTPVKESERGRLLAEWMWASLRKAAPKAKCYQLLGNHDVRMSKRIAEKVPELNGMIGQYALEPFLFDGVETSGSDRDALELVINGAPVVFHHGWLSKPGDHAKYFARNTVIGHSHSPHTLFHRHHRGAIWELNAGYVGNPDSHVFKYGSPMHKWTRAYATIDKHGPRVVQLET